MTLESFKKANEAVDSIIPRMYSRLSAVSLMEYLIKQSGGEFKPDIDRLLKYSDAKADYTFDFDAPHFKVNRDITVGELLRIALMLLSGKYSGTAGSQLADREGSYIVACLTIYPFTVLKRYGAENKMTETPSEGIKI